MWRRKQYGGECKPKIGGTIHAVFTDDSYNILISNKDPTTYFLGTQTQLDTNGILESLEKFTTKKLAPQFKPVGCFTVKDSSYYVLRISALKDKETHKTEIWIAPYTEVPASNDDSDIIDKTL